MSVRRGDPGRVVIIGAGPTGLGVAYRLAELGHRDFLVLDGAHRPGGLARSIVDPQGFTWDVGGHVQFSHYAYYDAAVDRAVGGQWLTHERESWIWIRGRFVPYPFQNNLHRLDLPDRVRVVDGLERARESRAHLSPPASFGEWIDQTFGDGLAELFMRPYNLKVWGYPLEEMSLGWMGERVAVPDVDRIKRQIAEEQDDVSWGPNRTFRFPVAGGTGAMWTGMTRLLPEGHVRFDTTVTSIDDRHRTVKTADDEAIRFDALVTTMPLDRCCGLLPSLPPEVRRAAGALRHSAVHIIGIGLWGPRPDTLARKCWMYFPERASPYYRVTVFSNYSPNHVPDEHSWSLMAEVCESPAKPVDAASLVDDVVAAFRRDGLITPATRIVSRWHHREEYGYPTPFLGRDEALDALRPALEARRVFSRGRFGAWKYEVSNQDHSFMQGIELVDRLVFGEPEVTIDQPDVANSGRFLSEVPQSTFREVP